MRNLSVFNPVLDVSTIGFRVLDDHAFVVIVTNWFMNLVRALLLDLAIGARRAQGGLIHVVPIPALEFTIVQLDGIGLIKNCWLLFPMLPFSIRKRRKRPLRLFLPRCWSQKIC